MTEDHTFQLIENGLAKVVETIGSNGGHSEQSKVGHDRGTIGGKADALKEAVVENTSDHAGVDGLLDGAIASTGINDIHGSNAKEGGGLGNVLQEGNASDSGGNGAKDGEGGGEGSDELGGGIVNVDSSVGIIVAQGIARDDGSDNGVAERIGRADHASGGPVGDGTGGDIGLGKLIAIGGKSRLGDGGYLSHSGQSPDVEAPGGDRKGSAQSAKCLRRLLTRNENVLTSCVMEGREK